MRSERGDTHAATTPADRPVAARTRLDLALADQYAGDFCRRVPYSWHRLCRPRLGAWRRRNRVWAGECCAAPAADDADLPADYSDAGPIWAGDQRRAAAAHRSDR